MQQGNPKRTLSLQQEAIYKKYVEDRGVDFEYVKRRRYRISSEVYENLFGKEVDVPIGHIISGKSTLYDENGKRLLQWVKTGNDKNFSQEIIEEIIEGINEKIDQATPLPPTKKDYQSNIINQYTLTDFHLGMMAWGEETGDDWDLNIAEELVIDWFRHAISHSPNAESCIFAQIGDFLHWDGLLAVTPASKHVLDADTRRTKLIRISLKIIRQIVSMLLAKYKKVHILMAEGNHDEDSSIWLREVFKFHYENEPRITVDTNPDPYYYYEFGSTLLFYHHGHKQRNIKGIETVFISKQKQAYGKSKNCYAHMGHWHQDESETNLMKVERHRTLAAKDAHASRSGYASGRDAKVITYHKEFGEVARMTINPEMVKHFNKIENE
tara:strand:+ start:2803 stop:3948 length:1146 start_codon:yes stop_codon:yes gene_type:complete